MPFRNRFKLPLSQKVHVFVLNSTSHLPVSSIESTMSSLASKRIRRTFLGDFWGTWYRYSTRSQIETIISLESLGGSSSNVIKQSTTVIDVSHGSGLSWGVRKHSSYWIAIFEMWQMCIDVLSSCSPFNLEGRNEKGLLFPYLTRSIFLFQMLWSFGRAGKR